MPEYKKLAILGGSSIATPLLVQELSKRPDCPPFEVCLVGRTRQARESSCRQR